MDDKSLQSKAVDIKGKQYVLVSDRVLYFNEKYENGEIATELLSAPDAKHIVVKAFIRPDASKSRVFIGHSQAVIGEGMVNKTAALENAETSAVGRALAFMGIGVIDSVASADELNKASHASYTPRSATPTPKVDTHLQDKKLIVALLTHLGQTFDKETVGAVVAKLTDLELIPANYADIIDRLETLRDEKNSDQ